MRWLARRDPHPQLAAESIDEVDLATLEVVEVDVDGVLRGPAPGPSAHSLPEVRYAPRERDATSLAGVWEALATY